MGERGIMAEGIARYFEDVKAVDGVDLSVDSGRIFGFLGPNGSGKTTLVKVLTTILAPTAGKARVAGFDVSTQQHEVRARVGVALQEVGLDNLMTAREMLVLQARLFSADRDRRSGRGRAAPRAPWVSTTSTQRSAWGSSPGA